MNNTQRSMLTFNLHTPATDNRPIYMAGNFNNWTADDERFKLTKSAVDSYYHINFPKDLVLPNPLEYKYLRGGWENVELDEFGNTTPNRILADFEDNGNIKDSVPHWRNYGMPYQKKYLPLVKIIDEAFEIPQLGRTRGVYALLPYDYYESEKSYPVLYLQDAQNLFNDEAPFGNWAIDKKLAILAEQGFGSVIIIAIDHGGSNRIHEFLPFTSQKFGHGDGKNYVKFIAETLKPFVDTNYRTKPNRLYTGIGGSSMGGLISIYAGLMFPKLFGRLMIFSPSLWIARNINFNTIRFFDPIPTRIYIYAGGNEGSNMVPNVKNFQNSITKQGLDNTTVEIKLSIDPKGLHTETQWGGEFPKAVKWLFN